MTPSTVARPSARQLIFAGCATFALTFALVGLLWQHTTWLHEPTWQNPIADTLGKVVCRQEADGTRTCVAENGAVSVLACGLGFASPEPTVTATAGGSAPAP